MSVENVNSEWLQKKLGDILSSPHISLPKAPLGMRMGHGPIDLFSTRILNNFTEDADGVVAGQKVDMAGLKAALLAIQRKWQQDTVKFVSTTPVGTNDAKGDKLVATSFTWTPRNASSTADVAATASVRVEGGPPRISSLTLDGDAELFRTESH